MIKWSLRKLIWMSNYTQQMVYLFHMHLYIGTLFDVCFTRLIFNTMSLFKFIACVFLLIKMRYLWCYLLHDICWLRFLFGCRIIHSLVMLRELLFCGIGLHVGQPNGICYRLTTIWIWKIIITQQPAHSIMSLGILLSWN